MNEIHFLNESVIYSDEYYNEGAALYFTSGAIAGISGCIAAKGIREIIEKKKFISDYEKSDIKIRASLAALRYELDNIYIPVVKSVSSANIDTDSDNKDFISDPSTIIKTIYKVYGIRSLSNDDNISEKLVLSEDIINDIADKVKAKSNDISNKEDLDKAMKDKYKQEFIDIYNQYVLAIKGLNCTALYNCKSGDSKLKLYINKNIDNYDLYNKIISTFINNLYKTTSNIISDAASNYIYLIGNTNPKLSVKIFNNKLYKATRASKSM